MEERRLTAQQRAEQRRRRGMAEERLLARDQRIDLDRRRGERTSQPTPVAAAGDYRPSWASNGPAWGGGSGASIPPSSPPPPDRPYPKPAGDLVSGDMVSDSTRVWKFWGWFFAIGGLTMLLYVPGFVAIAFMADKTGYRRRDWLMTLIPVWGLVVQTRILWRRNKFVALTWEKVAMAIGLTVFAFSWLLILLSLVLAAVSEPAADIPDFDERAADVAEPVFDEVPSVEVPIVTTPTTSFADLVYEEEIRRYDEEVACYEHFERQLDNIEDGVNAGVYLGPTGMLAFETALGRTQSTYDNCLARID